MDEGKPLKGFELERNKTRDGFLVRREQDIKSKGRDQGWEPQDSGAHHEHSLVKTSLLQITRHLGCKALETLFNVMKYKTELDFKLLPNCENNPSVIIKMT